MSDNVYPSRAVVFDIETRPHHELQKLLGIEASIESLPGMSPDELTDFAERQGVKLGNRKDPDKILSCIKENFEKEVSKAALHNYGAEISAIGIADICGGGVTAWVVDVDHSEKDMLQAFVDYLMAASGPILCGYYIRGFDLPMIRARCAALGIRLPHFFPEDERMDKYDRTHIFDAMDVLREGKLDQWLKMWGLPPKTASGAESLRMTPNELLQYVADDVERERLLIQKLAPNVARLRDLMRVAV